MDFCGDILDLVEETELLRDDAADKFLDSEVDNLIDVDNDEDLDSLAEFSFRNSLAAERFLGGEEDLELAEEDFLEDVPVELFDDFLRDAAELFLVDEVDDWPILTKPR